MWRRKGRAARTMPRADGHPPGRAAPATPRQLAPYTPGASAGRPRIACCIAADPAWRSSSPSISPTPPWRIRQGVAPLSGWFPVTTLGLSLTRTTAQPGWGAPQCLSARRDGIQDAQRLVVELHAFGGHVFPQVSDGAGP